MKTKNGFTFVELLGVITIIGILSVIVLPTIEKITKENKEKIYQQQLDNIILSLKSWASDNRQYLPSEENETLTITLSNLKADGYIEYEVKNPKNNKCFDNEMALQITKINNNYDYTIDLKTIKETDSCEIDIDSPIIILNGDHIENVEINSVYVEKGVLAKDKDGNDITNDVVITITGSGNAVDTTTLGNQYLITYSVTVNDKTSKISRTVKIVDTTSPELTVPGNLVLDTSATALDTMDGVSVTDNSGETIEVKVKSSINFGVVGKYTITYTASDSSGNTTTKKRIVSINKVVNGIMASNLKCIRDISSTCPSGTEVSVQVNSVNTYDFYVISDTGTELTLIMNQNLGNNVAWINANDYTVENNKDEIPDTCGYTACNDEGPITAVNILKERTDGWTNIDEREYVYSDDGGGNKYNSFTVTMKSRMLTSIEAETLNCKDSVGSCPKWLYTNLYLTGNDKDNSGTARHGFWISAASDSSNNMAYYIRFSGLKNIVETNALLQGIRPVITITK